MRTDWHCLRYISPMCGYTEASVRLQFETLRVAATTAGRLYETLPFVLELKKKKLLWTMIPVKLNKSRYYIVRDAVLYLLPYY